MPYSGPCEQDTGFNVSCCSSTCGGTRTGSDVEIGARCKHRPAPKRPHGERDARHDPPVHLHAAHAVDQVAKEEQEAELDGQHGRPAQHEEGVAHLQELEQRGDPVAREAREGAARVGDERLGDEDLVQRVPQQRHAGDQEEDGGEEEAVVGVQAPLLGDADGGARRGGHDGDDEEGNGRALTSLASEPHCKAGPSYLERGLRNAPGVRNLLLAILRRMVE